MRILVTGGSGLLGVVVVPKLRLRGHEVVTCGRHSGELHGDLSDSQVAAALLGEVEPEIIVNLAAQTNVDACERSPEEAYLANVKIVENCVAWIRQSRHGSFLVHLSSDQVYSGAGPHSEESVCPVNYYAFSKYAGELAAAQAPSTVLRTNFVGRSRVPGRVSLTDWLAGALRRQEPVNVFDDVLFSPLSIHSLADLITHVVDIRHPGVFNAGSREGMSKADFAFSFARVLGLPAGCLRRVRSSEVALGARRPSDMRMDSSRLARMLGMPLPSLQDEVESLRSEYCDEH